MAGAVRQMHIAQEQTLAQVQHHLHLGGHVAMVTEAMVFAWMVPAVQR